MKILVMGASGRLGREVVSVATERGHEVTAFARTPDPTPKKGVSPFAGDALRPARVAEAVPGHDAVVSALGKRGDAPTLTEGLQNLLVAMRQHEVRRIVVVGAQGVLDDPRGGLVRDRPEFPPFLKAISGEHLAAFRELQKSGLDWTMLCPPRMTEGGSTNVALSADRLPASEASPRGAPSTTPRRTENEAKAAPGAASASDAASQALGAAGVAYRAAAEAILDILEQERFVGQRVGILPAR